MTERPVFPEAVIGFRSWRLADWVLAPLSVGHPWRPGVNHAVCKADRDRAFWTSSWGEHEQKTPPANHSAPHQDCQCGLYAYHDLPQRQVGIVVGAVAAWGDLQVHCNGFRAEHAQILALAAAPGLEEVAETYGVPLVPWNMLAAEGEQHGSPLPVSLRPEKPKPKPRELSLYDQLVQRYQQAVHQQMAQLIQPSQVRWTYSTVPLYSSGGYSSGGQTLGQTLKSAQPIWTPADDQQKSAAEKLAKYPKPPANRQGPDKPQRPPRGSWSGR